MLRWRRPQGRLCATCPFFVETVPDYNEVGFDRLEEDLSDQASQSKCSAALRLYEAGRNSSGGKPTKVDRSQVKTRARATATQELAYGRELGYSWPVALYTKLKNKRPSPKYISTQH